MAVLLLSCRSLHFDRSFKIMFGKRHSLVLPINGFYWGETSVDLEGEGVLRTKRLVVQIVGSCLLRIYLIALILHGHDHEFYGPKTLLNAYSW